MRLTSESGVSALLSAVAGFLIAQSQMFVAKTPLEAFGASWFLLIYCTLFASSPAMIHNAFRFTLTRDAKPRFVLSLLGFLASFYLITTHLIEFGNNSNDSLFIHFRESYSGPLVILPLLWTFCHLIDEISANVDRS